jgi:DNA-directed RNA polymerase specialized sigma24 family protein
MKENPILRKAYEEKDWDTLLENCTKMLHHAWNKLHMDYYVGSSWREDGIQEAKLKLYKVLYRDYKENMSLESFIYIVGLYSLGNFRDYMKVRVRYEGVPLMSENEGGDFYEKELPTEDNMQDFLDTQLVKDHIESYESEEFKTAISLYLSGYSKKDISKMLKMWDAGLMAAINIFILRVKNELTDDYVDEEEYFKEKIRPLMWTYVKKHTKRREL